MFANFYDIVVVTDPRFQGGTNAAIAAEVTAAVQAGYKVALVAYEASNIRQPFPINARLAKLIDTGQLTVIVPGTAVHCMLSILHNPLTAGLLPLTPLQIKAEKRLVVVHHPPLDANGTPYYDHAACDRNAQELLAGPVEWVPVGPNARSGFDYLEDAPKLLSFDWPNVIDFDAWRGSSQHPRRETLTIGRHSRPDLRKFPDNRERFTAVYGTDPNVRVDLLGCPRELRDLLHPVARSWTLRPFGSMPVRNYLDQLDVFVYYHRSDWVEAFGYAVLEAMARGVPCVLPPSLAPSFGDAARIAEPKDALEAARELAENPEPARQAGFELIHQRHSYETVRKRLRTMVGAPAKKKTTSSAISSTTPGVLLISTNGIGMGHIARSIAVARRLQEPIRPVLVTMSQGAAVAAEFGYHVEFIPYHNYLGVDSVVWNRSLREELLALVDAFDARAVVFDGNSPFQGMLDAMSLRPHVWSIWSRRGMWQKNTGAEFINREAHFDAVLEPADIAEAFDDGPTPQSVSRTRKVSPILMLDPSEQLTKALARKELGLSEDATTILLQLGGGNNFDMRLCRNLVLNHLANRPDVQIVLLDWKISPTTLEIELPANALRLSTFPIARYLNAFDATVSAVGYNSFHEATAAALPAIYIPNENPSQDNQLARAAFAARHGAAFLARHDRPEQLIAALEQLMVPAHREVMSSAAKTLVFENGSIQAADLITQLVNCNRGAKD
jgi:predicted glycosyltransferase